MKSSLTFLIAIALCASAVAAGTPSFTGTWIFKADKSQGVGMMSAVAITAVVTQAGSLIKVQETSVSRGQTQTHDSTYDAGGNAKTNISPMGDTASTVSHLVDGKLVTTWTAPGAVSGTTNVQTETRSVSADGKIMSVEFSRNGKPGMVMVFERQ
jgi:hypothetical protein